MHTSVVGLRALAAVVLAAVVARSAAGAGEAAIEVDVILDSTQHWPGANDVLFSVLDASGGSLADERVGLEVRFTGPDGSVVRSRPAIERFAAYGRHLYRARVPLAAVGRWRIDVRAELRGGMLGIGGGILDVSDDMGTPPLGSRVPGGDTPTMRDAHSLMHHISSDPEPLTSFYTWSLDDALAQEQPTVFVLDSYAFRPNAACGGALGILHEVFIDYPGLTIIHAEPWQLRPAHDGHTLEIDPPGGPAELTDYAAAWGIEEPPWVFVIDRDGRLHAKFTGVIGSDELRAAITSVTPWRPVGTALDG